MTGNNIAIKEKDYTNYESITFKNLNISDTGVAYYNSGSFRLHLPSVFFSLLDLKKRKPIKYCAVYNYFYHKDECHEFIEQLYKNKKVFIIVEFKKKFVKPNYE